jgi:hypothetical protein
MFFAPPGSGSDWWWKLSCRCRYAFLAPIPANGSWLPNSSEPGIEIYS